jgi:hypothetical protein
VGVGSAQPHAARRQMATTSSKPVNGISSPRLYLHSSYRTRITREKDRLQVLRIGFRSLSNPSTMIVSILRCQGNRTLLHIQKRRLS